MALTDKEIALQLAGRVRAHRRSLGLTLRELARRSGASITSVARFETTGGVTLNNLIAILRALGLAGRVLDLVPDASTPSPLELLQAAKGSSPEHDRRRRR